MNMSVDWHQDATDGSRITMAHDNVMAKQLFEPASREEATARRKSRGLHATGQIMAPVLHDTLQEANRADTDLNASFEQLDLHSRQSTELVFGAPL